MPNDPGKDSTRRARARAQIEIDMRAKWRGVFVQGTDYVANDMATENGWLMIANKATIDNAAPQNVGGLINPILPEPAWTPQQVNETRIVYGQRYTLPVDRGGYLTEIRILVEFNMRYRGFVIFNPDVDDTWISIPEIVGTDASPTWVDIPIQPVILRAGAIFDFLVIVSSDKALDLAWNANYSYITPNNEGSPSSGEILHATKGLSSLKVHKTDGGSVDQSANLAFMTVGDTVVLGASTWTITQIEDLGAFVTFTVTPPVQDTSSGTQNVVFNYKAKDLIDYSTFSGHWIGNADVDGLFSTGTIFEPGIDDNAYGTDVTLQEAVVSDDWDFMAFSDAVTTSSGGGGAGAGVLSSGVSSSVIEFYAEFTSSTSEWKPVDAPVLWDTPIVEHAAFSFAAGIVTIGDQLSSRPIYVTTYALGISGTSQAEPILFLQIDRDDGKGWITIQTSADYSKPGSGGVPVILGFAMKRVHVETGDQIRVVHRKNNGGSFAYDSSGDTYLSIFAAR